MGYSVDQVSAGQFIPTTQVWDIGHLQEVDVNSADFKELLVRLYQSVNTIALAVNAKEFGQYLTQEMVNSDVYFNTASSNILDLRPVYRMVVNVGALGAGATAVNHGLTIGASWSFVRIYGAASNAVTGNYYPVPSPLLSLVVNNTQVVVTNTTGLAFLKCTVVLEYLKQ
jgi:hypothetical protein